MGLDLSYVCNERGEGHLTTSTQEGQVDAANSLG